MEEEDVEGINDDGEDVEGGVGDEDIDGSVDVTMGRGSKSTNEGNGCDVEDEVGAPSTPKECSKQ